jgi:hypothetical protein
MNILFTEVRRLIAVNARHRKGFRMREATPVLTTGHMVAEAAEALDSLLFHRPAEETVAELADTLACVIHTCIQLGVTEERLTEAVLRKLKERFRED